MANMKFCVDTRRKPGYRPECRPNPIPNRCPAGSGLELLVQASELIQAANEMNQAMETYQDAVETAKIAANDLAGKWEGAARDAFVRHQENAYSWHKQIIGIVVQMIVTIRKVVELYNRMEETVKDIVRD